MITQDAYQIGQTIHRRDSSGLFFHEATPEPVRRAIASLRGSQTRVRLFYGDIATGKTWSDEHDITGRISATMGPCKSPLLIHNARSMGGGAILTHCIVGILAKGGRWIYKAPNFNNGQWTAAPMDETNNGAVYRDGALYAHTRTLVGAERLRAFMAGESMRK